MKILAIETSCDETAVSIVQAEGKIENPRFNVLSNLVLSQIKTHQKYGGVFPAMARREHSIAIAPLIEQALLEAKLNVGSDGNKKIKDSNVSRAREILHRDPDLFEKVLKLTEKYGGHDGSEFEIPKIDAIAVTYGPGLEPALWVGLTVAQALSAIWEIPIIPINHMEGHIASILFDVEKSLKFPALALLISGGHTELVLIKDWTEYEIIGETRDDAVGEAFDKVARMLGLQYPGGPEISRLATTQRAKIANANNTSASSEKTTNHFQFPRPMINSGDFDFSFSGLKTSILYTIKKLPALDENTVSQIAEEFENTVTDVLIKKTMSAAETHDVKNLIIAGGVIANEHIRHSFEKITNQKNLQLFIPKNYLSTDNALMIAMCAYIRKLSGKSDTNILQKEIRAVGNARL